MILHEFNANDFLKFLIFSFVLIRVGNESQHLFLYPDGADYLVFSKNGVQRIDKINLQTKYQLNLEKNQEYFIVRFKPYALYYLQKEYLKYENLLKVISKNITTSNSVIVKKNSIALFIMELLDATSLENQIINIFNLIIESKGNIMVSQILLQENIHPKKLQRDFKIVSGLTPKEFINIIKFQNAISTFYCSVNKSKIIKTDPYYDYSHHSKSFKKYLRITPKDFINTKERHLKSIFNL